MSLITLEQSKFAYRADFALYTAAVGGLAGFLLIRTPGGEGLDILSFAIAGLFSWSLIEYLLHRFVLHGVQPFKGWHAMHHDRPTARICSPTILSAALILMLVFLPALVLTGVWHGCALTLGVLTGYLGYTVTHHATHHWSAQSAWLRRLKRSHAAHHHSRQPRCFGVTCSIWDHVFAST